MIPNSSGMPQPGQNLNATLQASQALILQQQQQLAAVQQQQLALQQQQQQQLIQQQQQDYDQRRPHDQRGQEGKFNKNEVRNILLLIISTGKVYSYPQNV